LPAVARALPLQTRAGGASSHGGRDLHVAGRSGLAISAGGGLERGAAAPVGTRAGPGGSPGGRVGVSPDDKYAFVTIRAGQPGGQVAVFNLRRALTAGFGPADRVALIRMPAQPAGVAVSPDGLYAYVTSGPAPAPGPGWLTVISLLSEPNTPAFSLLKTVRAGCGPGQVVVSRDSQDVWLTVGGGNAVVAYSAAKLLTDPQHALVARAFGIPVRTISLFLLGGMAHITRESPSPRAEFLIAVVGPATSLVVGLVGALASWTLWDVEPRVGALGLWLAMVNIPLAIFNLVPAYPLDGGRLLRGVLWFAGQDLGWASKISARVGQVAAVGLLFSGIWILFDGSSGALGGLWLIMIAWFMYAGAASSQYATAFQEALRRLTVASVMDRDFGRVQAGLSVQAFAEEHLLEKQAMAASGHAYAVYRDDYVIGLLSLRQLGRIPMHSWGQTSIERAMLPIESAPAMEPGAPALGALHLILEEGVEHIAVMAEGRLLGLVTRNELARASGQ